MKCSVIMLRAEQALSDIGDVVDIEEEYHSVKPEDMAPRWESWYWKSVKEKARELERRRLTNG